MNSIYIGGEYIIALKHKQPCTGPKAIVTRLKGLILAINCKWGESVIDKLNLTPAARAFWAAYRAESSPKARKIMLEKPQLFLREYVKQPDGRILHR